MDANRLLTPTRLVPIPHDVPSQDILDGSNRPRIQFSLFALMLFITIGVFVVALLLDKAHAPPARFEMAIRFLVVTPLAISEFFGVRYLVKLYKQSMK